MSAETASMTAAVFGFKATRLLVGLQNGHAHHPLAHLDLVIHGPDDKDQAGPAAEDAVKRDGDEFSLAVLAHVGLLQLQELRDAQTWRGSDGESG